MNSKSGSILITGAKGFVGKNLSAQLKNCGYTDIMLYDIDTPNQKLYEYAQRAEFVFHLAGVNRPKDNSEFYTGNADLTSTLLNTLKQCNNSAPVLLTSSIQALLNNDYGKSKLLAEQIMLDYAKNTNTDVLIFRMPGVFGKWCRPSYNSVVATFCHNVANNMPIEVRDESYEFPLVYIDDVVKCFINAMENGAVKNGDTGLCELDCEVYTVSLGRLATLIKEFKNSRETLSLPNVGDEFTEKLYATYLSYLPESQFNYTVKMNVDDRGSFTELFKTNQNGQVSVNIIKPGIVKGNHWHNTKNEKFVIVKGSGVVRFRKIDESEVIEYFSSGEKIEIIDIPTGYTHNIENTGDEDMAVVMWASEVFDADNPDTYFEKV